MKQKLSLVLSLLLALSMVFALAGCSKSETSEETAETASVYEQDLAAYADVIEGLKEGTAYAFADLCEGYDALLVTEAPITFDKLTEAAAATVYGFDKDGNVKELGTIESTTTSMPITVKDGYAYTGGHHDMSRASIDEKNAKLVIETVKETEDNYNDFFQAYTEGTMVEFTLV